MVKKKSAKSDKFWLSDKYFLLTIFFTDQTFFADFLFADQSFLPTFFTDLTFLFSDKLPFADENLIEMKLNEEEAEKTQIVQEQKKGQEERNNKNTLKIGD